MIRSANHSSFPRVDESPLDQLLRIAHARRDADAIDDAELTAVVDETITIIVAQQGRAFIDIVTDGMVGWDGPLSHLLRGFDGLRPAELFRWFDTNFYDRRVEVTGPISRRAPFLLHDYAVATEVAAAQEKQVKPVVPGPVTFSRLARDRHYGSLEALADAVADALAEEVAELRAAGARHLQIDEPLLCRHPEDLELVARTAKRVFEPMGDDAVTVLSTYFGDLTAVADRLDRLPGTHLGLDLTRGQANLSLLDRLPDGRGVVLGLFDARTTVQEDAADAAAVIEPHRESLVRRDVIVGPNAGLELLPRNQAFDKLLHARYLVEKLSQEWTWE